MTSLILKVKLEVKIRPTATRKSPLVQQEKTQHPDLDVCRHLCVIYDSLNHSNEYLFRIYLTYQYSSIYIYLCMYVCIIYIHVFIYFFQRFEGEANEYKTDNSTTLLQDMIQLDGVSPSTYRGFTLGENNR